MVRSVRETHAQFCLRTHVGRNTQQFAAPLGSGRLHTRHHSLSIPTPQNLNTLVPYTGQQGPLSMSGACTA
jgi:hypothetical protein